MIKKSISGSKRSKQYKQYKRYDTLGRYLCPRCLSILFILHTKGRLYSKDLLLLDTAYIRKWISSNKTHEDWHYWWEWRMSTRYIGYLIKHGFVNRKQGKNKNRSVEDLYLTTDGERMVKQHYDIGALHI